MCLCPMTQFMGESELLPIRMVILAEQYLSAMNPERYQIALFVEIFFFDIKARPQGTYRIEVSRRRSMTDSFQHLLANLIGI